MKKLVRLSLVSTTSIPPNTEITPEMITVKRPGTGIPANKIHEIIGNLSARAIPPDHILEPEDIKPQSTGF
ncbi:MAG: hypothetical protein KAT56_05715 [Sedimentisphaerales bacterium]|nr:hypothetical protein [Sedimentisphaerales bacterium]